MKTLKKKYSVAAFIDILGYKDLILKDSKENELESFIELKETIDYALFCTSESLKGAMKFLDNKNQSEEHFANRLNVKQFSDNVYFSFDYYNDDPLDLYFGIYIITTISTLYQRLMLGKGYFVRGGIANGLNLVDKNFIFSNALIKAVETEKETIYLRITFHKELRDILVNGTDNPFKQILERQYIVDWAEHVFLNPFLSYNRIIETEIISAPQDTLEEFKGMFNNLSNKHKRLIRRISNKYLDYIDDKKFISIARRQVASKIKKYKNKEQSIYEKYLWMRNLINWIEHKPSELSFKFI